MNYFYLLYFMVLFLLIFTGIIILKITHKKQLHYSFLVSLLLVLLWLIGSFFETYMQEYYGYRTMKFGWLWGIGLSFVPISLLLNGNIFAKTEIKFNKRYMLLLIVPLITYIMILTNDTHQLFITKFGSFGDEIIYGKYFFVHSIYSYTCVMIGLYYFLYFSIKNAGFFSRQSILIFIGSMIPFIVNLLFTLKIVRLPSYATALSFSFCIIFYSLAILKYKFLNVLPIALQNVVDHISDSYIIINEDLEVIDYNKTFTDTFKGVIDIKRKDNLIHAVNSNDTANVESAKLHGYIKEAIENRKTVSFEKHIVANNFDKHFLIEITPILSQDQLIGIIVLLKDITQHKKDLELIQQTQKQLVERERLASLGELAGGVAHDINSPLSAIQSGMYLIQKLTQKCSSLLDNDVLSDDVKKCFQDIDKCIQTNNSASQKIVKIVNSVRNHTRNLSGENEQDFYIKDVVEDLKVLLNHQLKQNNCELEITEEERDLIKGDPGKLSQVLTNLVVNAMQAYDSNQGRIEIKIGRKEENALIRVSDNAGGIPEAFRDGIFKNILTTKGTQGTGLGLYFSYSIITGHFGGDMWFESEEGKGTTFFILIPMTQKNKHKEAYYA